MAADDLEIAAILNQVKERVRARYPSRDGAPALIPLVDLMPLLQARDAAQAKVASIGSVNPRAGGPVNQLIQSVKRLISRSLSWFVRDQITFNRQVMACFEAALETLNEVNVSIVAANASWSAMSNEAAQLKDIRLHWHEWRLQWEKNLAANEMQFLRTAADLQTGFSYRTAMMETSFRDIAKAQHADYLGALDRATLDTQKRLWADLEKVRLEYDRLIHNELRLIRQRMIASPPSAQPMPPAVPASPQPQLAAFSPGALDYSRFADRFRGTEEYVRSNQQFYLPLFQQAGRVLDIGCGRGEFLELLRENGIAARGIELSDENVDYCRSKGLEVEKADLFEYLAAIPEQAEDAIFSSQVVEHIDPAQLPEMIKLCASRIRRGGLLALETPNPECLAIFATYFYLDPTHMRPVPHPLLRFYMEEAGLGKIEVHSIAPAVDSFPEIRSLPPDFAARFFGGLDYGIIGWKL